jgi:hypothetical protein
MIVAACLQMCLNLVVPSPWWAPDLVLASMVHRVLRRPAEWILPAAVSSVWYGIWAVRAAAQVMLACFVLAGVLSIAAGHVETEERRVQGWMTGIGCMAMRSWALWAEAHWSLPLAGLVVVQGVLTAAASLLLSDLTQGRRPAWRDRLERT